MGIWASGPCYQSGGKDDDRCGRANSPAVHSIPPHVPSLTGDNKQSIDWQHYTQPWTWMPTLLATSTLLGIAHFYRSYLRRIPSTNHIAPGFFRRRSLVGKVTSVGDGDNFHLFHTPGGFLAGWGWLRKVPNGRKVLKGRTIPVRIAGVDAPEGAHFGRPAQPFASESLSFLQEYLLGRRVRAYIYRRDQYERVVATVFVRGPPFFLAKDVGLEMLRRGLATTYEAKMGVEFGGPRMEVQYRAAQAMARQKGRGMWAHEKPGFFRPDGLKELESPRQYKDRMRGLKDKPELKAEARKKAAAGR